MFGEQKRRYLRMVEKTAEDDLAILNSFASSTKEANNTRTDVTDDGQAMNLQERFDCDVEGPSSKLTTDRLSN